MIDPEQPLSAKRRSATSTTCSRRSRGDPAMLVFLDGIHNDRRDPNENHAREMMELFLARRRSRRPTRARRARDGARAERLDGRLDRKRGASELSVPRLTPRRPATRPCSVRPASGAAKTPCACAWSTRCTRRSSRPSCGGGTSCRPRRRTRRSRPCRGSTLAPATRSGPSSRRSCSTPTSSTARSSGRRRSSTTPACCVRSAGRSTRPRWAWLGAGAGQQLFYPPNVSGWDFTRWLTPRRPKARWELASYVTSETHPQTRGPARGKSTYSGKRGTG